MNNWKLISYEHEIKSCQLEPLGRPDRNSRGEEGGMVRDALVWMTV